MSQLPDVPVVDSTQSTDNVLLNRGRQTRQVPVSTLLSGVGGEYTIEQYTATSNYTLPDTTADEVWVFIDGDSYDLTIPVGSGIATGTKFKVFNTSNATEITINEASGATLENFSGALVGASNSGLCYAFAEFYKKDTATWFAFGDLTGAP